MIGRNANKKKGDRQPPFQFIIKSVCYSVVDHSV